MTDRVLFDDVWSRDPSLITLAALIAFDRPDQFRFHRLYAIEEGVARSKN